MGGHQRYTTPEGKILIWNTFKSVEVSKDGNSLIIEVPINHEMPLSKSGMSRLLFCSGHPRPSGKFVGTEEIMINCVAYVRRIYR
jgi:hypothetical protein